MRAAPALKATIVSSRTRAIFALVSVTAAIVIIHLLGPRPPSWYPPCVLHHFTGLLCPGCGCARAWHALGRGHVGEALNQNLLATALVPMLAGWWGVLVWRGLRHDRAPLAAPNGTARIILVATIIFVIARNLPWWPFALLAAD